MTPAASWRPVGLPRSAFILGPASCLTCRAAVWYGRSLTRVQGQETLGEARVWRDWGAYRTHRCAKAIAA